MSFSERTILWLHVVVAIFTIGPVTAAIMSTPRFIRKRNAVIVGHLYRTTRIYAIASLLVFVFGIVLADMLNELSKPWLSVSMTLFVVALVLLFLILRDQRKAFNALNSLPASASSPEAAETETDAEDDLDLNVTEPEKIAAVERGRIASLGGITGIIWLVILVLMVWR